MKAYPKNAKVTKDHRTLVDLLSKDDDILCVHITKSGDVKISKSEDDLMCHSCGCSCSLIIIFKPISDVCLSALLPVIMQDGILIDYS